MACFIKTDAVHENILYISFSICFYSEFSIMTGILLENNTMAVFMATTTTISNISVMEQTPYVNNANNLRDPHKIIKLLIGAFAIIANILNILAILKTRCNLSSHYRMIVSLALSDILTGISLVWLLVNKFVNPIDYSSKTSLLLSRCSFMIIKALNTTALNVTLLNLMGMALDHYMAILKPLHYPSLMNKRRADISIIMFWIFALVCGFSDFFSGYKNYYKYAHKYNYCEFIWRTPYQDEYILFAIALLCCLVMCGCYVRIILTVKRRRNAMLALRSNDMRKNQKALYTTLLILGTFMVCWLPTVLFQVALIIQVHINPKAVHIIATSLMEADQYLFDLLLLNTLLDPIIYAVRMREVRFGYKKLWYSICHKRPTTRGRRLSADYNSSTHCTSVLLDERKFSTRTRLTANSFRFIDKVNDTQCESAI